MDNLRKCKFLGSKKIDPDNDYEAITKRYYQCKDKLVIETELTEDYHGHHDVSHVTETFDMPKDFNISKDKNST